ncbi:MAG TPA: class I SAM-dependent methyltransferase [Arenimonas sp.]|nr:class I SAM-dependent methyltransferase [Arenimonas sp.]
MSERQAHWQSIYSGKAETQTSWFRPRLNESLRLIDGLELDRRLPVIDVGGGRATLVDDLLARGFLAVTVLDLSEAALADSRERLGAAGKDVTWNAADILKVQLPEAYYGLWHDRAVFHFLTEAGDRCRYAELAARSIRPGGHLLLATFALDGPERCSGLPICRYDAASLADEFAAGFDPVNDSRELHATPMGGQQAFTYLLLRRKD